MSVIPPYEDMDTSPEDNMLQELIAERIRQMDEEMQNSRENELESTMDRIIQDRVRQIEEARQHNDSMRRAADDIRQQMEEDAERQANSVFGLVEDEEPDGLDDDSLARLGINNVPRGADDHDWDRVDVAQERLDEIQQQGRVLRADVNNVTWETDATNIHAGVGINISDVNNINVNEEYIATREYVDQQVAEALANATAADDVALAPMTQFDFDTQLRTMVEQVIDDRLSRLLTNSDYLNELDNAINNAINTGLNSRIAIEDVVKEYLLHKLNGNF